VQRRGSSFIDGLHHLAGGGLLDHMAGARNAMHFALPDLAVRGYAVTHPSGTVVLPTEPGWDQLLYASAA